jgi:RNA polymerase sigma-70 factor, ECF subfamily
MRVRRQASHRPRFHPLGRRPRDVRQPIEFLPQVRAAQRGQPVRLLVPRLVGEFDRLDPRVLEQPADGAVERARAQADPPVAGRFDVSNFFASPRRLALVLSRRRMSPTDAAVREQSDEPLEFEDLVRQHQRMVFSLAFHFLRDRAAAEEVAQDVFLRLHRHLDSLGAGEGVVFWLRRVTSNRCIDYARQRRFRLLSFDTAPEPAVEPHARDPLLSRRLRRLVASLPRQSRMVVILRYQEDLMPEEIARILDEPVASVKSQLHRALRMLREKMIRVVGDPR